LGSPAKPGRFKGVSKAMVKDTINEVGNGREKVEHALGKKH
jgi:hypothetical protein